MLKKQDGFTLVEMLIVLMIISVLILLIIPNLTGRSSEIHDKGCEALSMLVQAQTNAYALDKGMQPASLTLLVEEDYITSDQLVCQNGTELIYSNGVVSY